MRTLNHLYPWVLAIFLWSGILVLGTKEIKNPLDFYMSLNKTSVKVPFILKSFYRKNLELKHRPKSSPVDKILTEIFRTPGKKLNFRSGKRGKTLAFSGNRAIQIFGQSNIDQWLVKLHKGLPFSFRKKAAPFLEQIIVLSHQHNLDPLWVISIICVESGFNTRARSHANAMGLMQIVPRTGVYLGKLLGQRIPYREISTHLYQPDTNLKFGIFYLSHLLKSFKNDHRLATMAYNLGPTLVRFMKVNKRPTYRAAREYYSKVNYYYQLLQRRTKS